MLNKRNINSVCLLRKDLLSDKVSTKGPPEFENLTSRPLGPARCFHRHLPVLLHTPIMCTYTHRMRTDSEHARIHTHEQKEKLFKSHLNKVH